MAQRKLTNSQLHKLGYPPGAATEKALDVLTSHFKGKSVLHKRAMLKRVLENPALYQRHEVFSPLAQILLETPPNRADKGLSYQSTAYTIYGKADIAQGAIDQMDLAMRLPIAKAGALMADAHKGYGLPIGGVLATENAVIPYGVGVDIGCRMCMTLYDIPATYVQRHKARLTDILMDNTRFGQTVFSTPMDHQVLEAPLFNEIQLLRNLKDKARKQIGTSGGGNHFVEFGMTEIVQPMEDHGLSEGQYLAVLSHSGSRGFGATIAQHYTKMAMQHTNLPTMAKHLAWLDLDREAGQEYWLAMNLAGAYAKACHDQIHQRLAAALGERSLATIENHHNFAWKEKDSQGNEMIVHRKGATPAAAGVMGIIPGSMTAPGFIVRGKGNHTSLNSASHGAGRVMSRSQAKSTLSKKEVAKSVKKAGITLLGSGIDEAPQVYKDIHQVMAQQQSLVEVIGTFKPAIVRMCKARE